MRCGEEWAVRQRIPPADPSWPWWRVNYQYRYSLPTGQYVRWTWMEVQAKTAEEAQARVQRIIFERGTTLEYEMRNRQLDPCRVEPSPRGPGFGDVASR